MRYREVDAKRFAGVLAAVGAVAATEAWYVGQHDLRHDPVSFADHIGSSLSQTISSASTAPSSGGSSGAAAAAPTAAGAAAGGRDGSGRTGVPRAVAKRLKWPGTIAVDLAADTPALVNRGAVIYSCCTDLQ